MNEERASFEAFYKNIGKIYCPYFKDYIHFTDVGIDHLRFKNKFTLRTEKDRDMRIKMLPRAIHLIGKTVTLQNRSYRRRFETRYINSRKENILTDVKYYEFVAIIEERHIRVVIKQIENKEKVFLSVIPLFKQKMPLEESDIL
ncbi:MAG: hypothetical protein KGJ35_01755 [Patescibacteria group bacterium]|nr:hypothetical protein [Patescibacteria group bacterium]